MKKEDMKHAINEIFKASESLREALDTLDLGGYVPQGAEVHLLAEMQTQTERIAQLMQAKAKKEEAEEAKQAKAQALWKQGKQAEALETLFKDEAKAKA